MNRVIKGWFAVWGLLLALALTGVAPAQSLDWGLEQDLLTQLQRAQDDVRDLQKRIDKNRVTQRQSDVKRTDARLQESQELARQSVRQLERRQQILSARLQEVGESPGPGEHEAVRSERQQLQKSMANLQTQLRLARLVQVEATQTRDLLQEARQNYEGDKRWRRESSLLLMQSWPDLKAAWPTDRLGLLAYYQQWQDTWDQYSWKESNGSVWLLVSVLLGGLILLRILPGLAVRWVPGGRLRRSALALANFLVWGLLLALVLWQLILLIFDRPQLNPEQSELLGLAVIAGMLSGLGVGAVRAVVLQPRSSWRLFPISEQAYRRLRYFPWVYLFAIYLDVLSDLFDSALEVSHIFSISVESLSILAYLMVYGYGFWGLASEQWWNSRGPGQAVSWARWFYRLMLLLYAFSCVAYLGGWLGLASDILTQFLSLLMVVGILGYLLSSLLQDISDTLLAYINNRTYPDEQSQERSRVHGQWIIVLFASARVLVWGLCVWVISSDWLVAPRELLESGLDSASKALLLSAVQWRLDLWLLALAVLLLGIAAINLLRNWMMHSFMPTSRLEPGLQRGITGTMTYGAYFTLVVVCLTMLGVPVNAVTWIFTAFSVGLGFGLRGIVQNLASGLVLMLERPFKVGDWVEVDGSEGNVRELRFRATYVERFDQTLLVVPNADMVGRPVRNLTPEGKAHVGVDIKLLLPLDVDADLIMQILHEAVQEQPDVLTEPAPRLFCDGIQGDGLLFGGRCFIASARNRRAVRSGLTLSILRRLRSQGISLHQAQRLLGSGLEPETVPSPVRVEL